MPDLSGARALLRSLRPRIDDFLVARADLAELRADLPGERDGEPVLWCWLEGDADITWYHRLDTGFAGRRPTG
jgi:hypothetical protein